MRKKNRANLILSWIDALQIIFIVRSQILDNNHQPSGIYIRKILLLSQYNYYTKINWYQQFYSIFLTRLWDRQQKWQQYDMATISQFIKQKSYKNSSSVKCQKCISHGCGYMKANITPNRLKGHIHSRIVRALDSLNR